MDNIGRFVEMGQIVQGIACTDVNGAATTGDYVSLRKYNSCLVLFEAGGTMGATCNLTLLKATDVTPTGATTLAFTEYWSKAIAAGAWTKTTGASSTIATGTTTSVLYAIQIDADELGVSGTTPYTALAGVISNPGSTNYMSLKYILFPARHAQATLLSAIVD